MQHQTAQALTFYRNAVMAANKARQVFHTEEFRSSTFGTLSTIFDEAIALQFSAGQTAEAFDTAEQARARTLTDMIRGRIGAPREAAATVAEVQQSLGKRSQTVLLSYYVLPDAVLLWTVRANEISGVRIGLNSDQLDQQIRDFRNAITAEAPAQAEVAS